MKLMRLLAVLISLLTSSAIMASERDGETLLMQAEVAPIEINVYDSCIHVKNAPVGSVIEIYSVVGIKVKEIKIKESEGKYPVNIPKGYYIIRIGETVRKIVIR